MQKVIDPYSLVVEGRIYITKYKTVLSQWTNKKEEYDKLLEREEYLTEIDTRYFKNVLDMIINLLIAAEPIVSRCDDALNYISRNVEELRKTDADALEIVKKIEEEERELSIVKEEVEKYRKGLNELKKDMIKGKEVYLKLNKEIESGESERAALTESEVKTFVQDAYSMLKASTKTSKPSLRGLTIKMYALPRYSNVPPVIRKIFLTELLDKVAEEFKVKQSSEIPTEKLEIQTNEKGEGIAPTKGKKPVK